jgi:hypothetical protein
LLPLLDCFPSKEQSTCLVALIAGIIGVLSEAFAAVPRTFSVFPVSFPLFLFGPLHHRAGSLLFQLSFWENRLIPL